VGIGEILWRFLDDDRTLVDGLSGRAFAARVGAARAGLRRRGVRAGDRVVWVAPNSADWLAVDLAVLAEGAVGVPLYERLGEDEIGRAHV
jgi:long-chain acyl-CoA synthetase